MQGEQAHDLPITRLGNPAFQLRDHPAYDPPPNLVIGMDWRRSLNRAFYMLAIIRISHDPRTAIYLTKQRANGKTKKEAIRSLNATSSAVSTTSSTTPTASQPPSA
ncbi:MAG: hypothetical protein ABI355_15980 [Solirubrobacteraceae bacterium]